MPRMFVATLMVFFFVPATAIAKKGKKAVLPFEELSMIFEVNETDGDAEVVIEVEAFEGLRMLRVRGPNGKKAASLTSRDLNFGRRQNNPVGLREFTIETAEPSIEAVMQAYPEGIYQFEGRTVSGAKLFGEAELTHDILPAPEFSPADGEEVDPNNAVVSWDAVPGATGYLVEVEQDELEVSFNVEVGPEIIGVSIPPELLTPGVEYEVGVGVVSEDDNLTVVESDFVTSLAGEAPALCSGAFTEEFFPTECTHLTQGSSPFFILEPGYRLVLEGEEEDDEGETIELLVCITILEDTEMVNGVLTRVMEEREFEDGEIVEVSRNFMTICQETGDVYYHGEDVDDYEDGEIVSHSGEWRAGVDGATAGVLVPASPMIGARMFQEMAPGVAMDQGTVVAVTDDVEVDAGTFDDVLFIYETTALDPLEESFKHYAAGVGLIIDDEIELVEHGFVENPSEPCMEEEG